jgi:hypothetical protein
LGFLKVVLLEVPFYRELSGFLGRVFPGVLLGGVIVLPFYFLFSAPCLLDKAVFRQVAVIGILLRKDPRHSQAGTLQPAEP